MSVATVEAPVSRQVAEVKSPASQLRVFIVGHDGFAAINEGLLSRDADQPYRPSWTSRIVRGDFVYFPTKKGDDRPATADMSPEDLLALELNNRFGSTARLVGLGVNETDI